MHVDAAHGRRLEGADQLAWRQKIGRHDPDRVAGAGDRRRKQHRHAVEILVRTVGEGPADDFVMAGLDRRSVAHDFAGGELPGAVELQRELSDNRAHEPEVNVRGRPCLAGLVDAVPVADVHAAGEPDPVVDHQDLVVIAQVDRQRGWQQARRQEAGRAHAGLAQAVTGARPRIPFADTVDEHAHVHAARNGGRQGSAEVLPGLVLIEDVGGQADMVAGGLDGLEHGRVGLLAVEKRFHTVAADQGMSAQRPAAAGQFGESLGQVLR